MVNMFDVGESLQAGVARASSQLLEAQTALARASAGAGKRSADAAMARTAQSAIFTEALIAAIKSRFSEIKNAAK